MEKIPSPCPYVEHQENTSQLEQQPTVDAARETEIKLFHGDDIILVPTPSSDPKWAILILVSAYTSTAVLLCSGMGAIFSIVLLSYPGEEKRASDLMTFPTLSMVIGRRPVFLASVAIMVCGLRSLRISEATLRVETSRQLGWLLFIQTIGVGAFFIASQYLVTAYGWRWWYGLFTIINGVILLLSIPLAAETAYKRPESDLSQAIHLVTM
ncbi:hypothetical protein BJX68DRAFT_267144 [Aspergillus pseudodeflectus]|uniref:Major facilitator superfamily (MFS) profile domain-containing protein n=1 Tax=Aspergillus pseudodeflectus TaxID=176178 RepID=A0ABR4KAH5_9EURO